MGSNPGSISYRDYYSRFVCRERDRKVGGLIIDKKGCVSYREPMLDSCGCECADEEGVHGLE